MNGAGLDFENGQSSKRGVIKEEINQGPLIQTTEEASKRQQLTTAHGWEVGVTWKRNVKRYRACFMGWEKNVLKLTR